MPLFMCVSGAIYMQCILNGKYECYTGMVLKKSKRLLIPYFFWGICYVAPVVKWLDITTLSFGKYVLFGIILGADSRHLWYLWTLFLYFVFGGCLDKIIKRRWHNNVLLWSFVITCIISCFNKYVPTIFALNYFVRYLCFFILGMVINLNRNIIKLRFRDKVWTPVILFSGFFLCYMFRQYIVATVLAALLGIFISFWLTYRFSDTLEKSWIVGCIKKYSMGIYIFHPMVIYIWFYFVGNRINAFASCGCAFITSISVSILFVMLLRKVKMIYLIGE